MARKKFKIRTKPSKPVRKKNQAHEESISYDSLQSVIATAESWGAPFEECEIDIRDEGYYSPEYYAFLVWTGPEDVGVFEQRLVDYGRKLKLYEVWAEDNKVQIAEELAIRKVEKKEADQKAAQKEVDKLSKELAKNQKRLKKLEAAMS